MQIWIDADACPTDVREIVYGAAGRAGLPVTLVACQRMRVPEEEGIRLLLVPGGEDAADNRIAEECAAGDLVITADIPLAARIVETGATGLDPRGELYTEANVRERLSMRNFMEEMRFAGLAEGGPAARTGADTRRFANALDRFLARRGGGAD